MSKLLALLQERNITQGVPGVRYTVPDKYVCQGLTVVATKSCGQLDCFAVQCISNPYHWERVARLQTRTGLVCHQTFVHTQRPQDVLF